MSNYGSEDGNVYLCVIDDFGGITEVDAMLPDDDDIYSVEVYGNVILAGDTWESALYRSDDGGDTFDYVDGPSGTEKTRVYMPTVISNGLNVPGPFDGD